MPRPSASAIPMMAWTRTLPEAAGLRPTASAALKPMRPTPRAAPRRPNALVILPVISAMSMVVVFIVLLGFRRAHAWHAPGEKVFSGTLRRDERGRRARDRRLHDLPEGRCRRR